MAKLVDRMMFMSSIIPKWSSSSYITSFVSTGLYDFVAVSFISKVIQVHCHIFVYIANS